MQAKTFRAAVVGASTPLGRELAEQMADATDLTWDVTLLDAAEDSGKLSAAGEEAVVVQAITPGGFDRMNAVFFAGDASTARKHWREAQSSGALVIDLTGALRKDGIARTLAQGAGAGQGGERVVAPVHPAALMLAGLAQPLRRKFPSATLAATALLPASEWGQPGLDELQKQTIGLLSFQSVPKDIFDTQVAFNLSTTFGPESILKIEDTQAIIAADFALLVPGCELALQALQAPVFNGVALSVFVSLPEPSEIDQVRSALEGGFLQLASDNDPAPSNDSVAGEKTILATIHPATGNTYGVWLVADNISLTAQTAIASARQLSGS